MREMGANAGTEFQRPAKPPYEGQTILPSARKKALPRELFQFFFGH